MARDAVLGKSLSDTGVMSGHVSAERTSDAFGSLHLEHSSTVDRVAEELRRAVFEGELESGTPLREVALAESLGVSRPTLREALAVLVAEGLATREPNRGVTVASPDPESVRDVSRVRAVLETAGVRHWPTAGEDARDAVRQALGAYESAVADGRVVPGAQPATPRHPPEPGRADRVAEAGRDGRVGGRRAAAWLSRRSTAYDATPATRPASTTTCSSSSSPVMSTPPSPS